MRNNGDQKSCLKVRRSISNIYRIRTYEMSSMELRPAILRPF